MGEEVLIGVLVAVLGTYATWMLARFPKFVQWAWQSLQSWRRSASSRRDRSGPYERATTVRAAHHGGYDIDVVPLVAGPSREWNEAWSNVLRGQKQPVRFRPIARGSRGTYRGYHSERY